MPTPSSGATAGAERARYEVADVVRAVGAAYRRTHPVSAEQARVLHALGRCRTAALGGHVEACDACGTRRVAYNSCRNRHCPKCQGGARAHWLTAQQALLLPVPYFHLVFTLPHELNALVRINARRLYALLFRAAAASLQTFARDPLHLGAELGVTAVLHTWGQTLTQHVHVHCVVTGGGLSPDGQRWVHSRPRFLFPVRALSQVFRGKFLAGLQRLRAHDALTFAGASAALAEPPTWAAWLATLRTRAWLVYAKPPFGGPERVLKYLSRYTHRVAISNARLAFVGADVVRFHWKDYADHHRTKLLALAPTEFLRRFLLHVVPPRLHRMRHFGLLANRQRAAKLAQCRALLTPHPTPPTPPAAIAPLTAAPLTLTSITRCPACGGGPLRVIETLAPQRGVPP